MTLAAAAASAALALALWFVAARAARRRSLALGAPPWIALAGAACAGMLLARPGPDGAAMLCAVCGALVAGAVDVRCGFIFDPLPAATALAALGFAAANGTLPIALAGAATAAALLGALHVGTRGHGLGLGDVKLGAALGMGLGPYAACAAVGLAFILGGAYGCWLLATGRARRADPVRFGPFLAAGTFALSAAGWFSAS